MAKIDQEEKNYKMIERDLYAENKYSDGTSKSILNKMVAEAAKSAQERRYLIKKSFGN